MCVCACTRKSWTSTCVCMTRMCMRLLVVDRSLETTASRCHILFPCHACIIALYIWKEVQGGNKREERERVKGEEREREREREVVHLAEQCRTKDKCNQSLNHLTEIEAHTLVTKPSLGLAQGRPKMNIHSLPCIDFWKFYKILKTNNVTWKPLTQCFSVFIYKCL